MVHGWGKADGETKKEPRNPEWVLAVTAFDVSALPPSRQVMGNIIMRNLVDTLNTIAYRIRVSPEYLYYEEYAWSKDRAAAAKNLTAKRKERDALIFQGEPEWRYQKNLKTKDTEIQKLEETLRTVEKEAPPITAQPVFKCTPDNTAGVFPPPPKAGGEYQFCVTQKADAFLAGDILEFHGRLYVNLKLYTLYTQSFPYEDSIIFSIENIQQGVDELADRLVAVVSGAKPAAILIHGNPEDAVLMIDGAFAGQGEVGPREHPPGTVQIEGFANHYQAFSTPLELQAGELAELYINLQPLSREALTIQVPEQSSAQVYQGALYLGQAPLQVEVPLNQLTFIHVETPEGKTGSRIIQGGAPSPAVFVETPRDLFLETAVPTTAAEQRVTKARRQYYGAWGRFWIALPIAFVLQGINSAQVRAVNNTPPSEGPHPLYKSALDGYYISIGAWIVFGLVTAEVLFRAGVYLYTSWKDADPLVRSPSASKSTEGIE
jgi:hypothetical protein